MLSTNKPKSIQVIGFDSFDYNFLKKFRHDLIIFIPFTFAEQYSLLYDANGNLVYDKETDIYREYNELNQLTRVRLGNLSNSPILEEYIWHPIEERILVKDVYNNDC